jgi:molybdate transport system ATP-binding protein
MDALRVEISLPLRRFELDLELEASAGIFALAGPSGAGKTSVLRAIAGLVRPRRGRISCGDEIWFDAGRGIHRPPEERSVGFVFQEYALFPHLTVEQNVAYAGKAHARDLIERLGLSDLANERPAHLSGGERQRVALARALARRPRVLLLDEPLAALDTHTRGRVRGELRERLRREGLPALLVTHDYADAAALADRIGVIVDGRLVQTGTPEDLIAAPSQPFVADFVGANVLHGRSRATGDGLAEVVLEDGSRFLSTDVVEGEVALIVYPWEITVGRAVPLDSAQNHLRGRVETMVPMGNRVRVRIGPLTAEITTLAASRIGLEEGQPAVATFKATGTRLVPLG